ncbi:TetR/AcrR family transcriptional regulator [Gallaecimonas pentaromativorans]|uniref:TetR/AcrR family transcriptional regulator n=1 Tax=Gallaecimonas pentaromativorans TaxID=584787 RepID=UPI003A949AC7
MTKTRQTDRKREAIITAAINEFSDNGFESTSMDKVAARAEVSKRTVYNHFPSKEILFAECLDALWQSCQTGHDNRYDPNRPLRAQLAGILGAKVAMMQDSNFMELARVAVAAGIHAPERAQAIVERIGQREQGFTHWIAAAQADGRLKAVDPHFAAQQLHGLLKAFAFWPQLTLGAPPLGESDAKALVERTLDMFLACYG